MSFEELKNIIEDITLPIYILGHENPDYDSVGSALALVTFLNKIGKEAYMVIEDEVKYMTDIFTQKDNVVNDINHKDFFMITVDISDIKRLGVYQKYFDSNKNAINIDHHESNQHEVKYTLSLPSYTSTCEIIYELFKNFDVDIDANIAEMLYSGIISDTQRFLYAKSPDTFYVAGNLIKYGFDSTRIMQLVMFERSEESIVALKDMLENLKFDEFHYLVIDTNKEIYQGFKGMYRVKKNMPIFQHIKDVNFFVVFFIYDNNIRCSLRSKNDIRVDKIAELFDGGGHKHAAGYSTSKCLAENIRIIKDYINNKK